MQAAGEGGPTHHPREEVRPGPGRIALACPFQVVDAGVEKHPSLAVATRGGRDRIPSVQGCVHRKDGSVCVSFAVYEGPRASECATPYRRHART